MATDVKPRSNRLLMVLGIVVAVVAFLLVILIGGNKGGTSTEGRTVEVVVAAVDIPVGTQISGQLIKLVKFAPDQEPAGDFHATACGGKAGCVDPTGQFAAVALPKNTALSASNVVASTAQLPPVKKPYLNIPKGQVAVVIPAGGELQAVGGWIQPDDRVDVLASGLPGEKSGEWKAVYQNLIIQRVGPVGAANTQGLSSSYTLFVPLDEAENLTFLFNNGTYKFVLKSQLDASPTDTLGPASSAGANSDSFNASHNVPR